MLEIFSLQLELAKTRKKLTRSILRQRTRVTSFAAFNDAPASIRPQWVGLAPAPEAGYAEGQWQKAEGNSAENHGRVQGREEAEVVLELWSSQAGLKQVGYL